MVENNTAKPTNGKGKFKELATKAKEKVAEAATKASTKVTDSMAEKMSNFSEAELVAGLAALTLGGIYPQLPRFAGGFGDSQTEKLITAGALTLVGAGLSIADQETIKPISNGVFSSGASLLGWNLSRLLLGPATPSTQVPAQGIVTAARTPAQAQTRPAQPALTDRPQPQPQQARPMPGRTQPQPQPQPQPHQPMPAAFPTQGNNQTMPPPPRPPGRTGPRPAPVERPHAGLVGRSWGVGGGTGLHPKESLTGINPETSEEILFSRV